MITISRVIAREVLDSRGSPTVEVEVALSDGAEGRAAVPSGASTGGTEALELRDGDRDRFHGRGVLKAVENVRERIAPEILGRSALDQEAVDTLLIELDGTPDKRSLGANAILGVSMAVAHAAARSRRLPLYRYLQRGADLLLPVPMLNIINGGRHAEDSTDFQEFMVIPAGFDTFRRALRAGAEIYGALKDLIGSRGLNTNVGDEGGFAPSLSSNRDAVELVLAAIEKAGYEPGRQCFIGLDVAATELLATDGRYSLPLEGRVETAEGMIDMYESWAAEYPLVSIEDGMAEEDWEGWSRATERLGHQVQLVGDDLYTTNPARIEKGIELKASNAVLIKLNQIGTVSETLEAVATASEAGWGIVISHRSGETEDTTIADLAVATGAGQIKSGAPARGERTAKYNRLLRIEEEMGDTARFAGVNAFARSTR
ncbi:MAG: phosphopyruvate hydratase [Chloroflexi bacterium]|nr:phosphopyruvate hydratase [Chloroflexota bacterium]